MPADTGSATALSPRSAWFEPSVHSAYFQIFAQLLASRQLGAPRPFTGQARLLPLLDYLPMLDAINAPGAPEAGIEVGQAISVAAHGPMGLAAMSSASLGQAMQAMGRYAPVRNRLFDYRCTRDAQWVSLRMPTRLPLGGYAGFLQNATVYAKFNILRSLADPAALRSAMLCLPWPRPARLPEPLLAQPWSTEYDSPELAVRFPLAVADAPLATSDPELHRRVCAAGEEELVKLSGSVAARVRHLMHQAQPRWPTLVELAQALGVSRRTLVRRLDDEDLGYQDLLDEARNELACWYLRQSRLSLAEVAEQVGFSDQANFSRGFRRWQGLTPSAYRQCFRSSAPAS